MHVDSTVDHRLRELADYVKTRLVDIGDHIQAGQLLAIIDSPDIDDQLNQARADLAQARANLAKARADETFARADERRSQRLLSSSAVSHEDYERSVQGLGVATAAVGAMEAAIKVQEAAVQRYTDLQGFEKITAPFPGDHHSPEHRPGRPGLRQQHHPGAVPCDAD